MWKWEKTVPLLSLDLAQLILQSESLFGTAHALKEAGVNALGGVWKPRTNPYSFQRR